MGLLGKVLDEAMKAKTLLSSANSKFIAVYPKLREFPGLANDMKSLLNAALKSANDLIGGAQDAEQELDVGVGESIEKDEGDMKEDDLLIPKPEPVEEDDMPGEYEGSLKDNIGDIIMDDSLDAEAKIAKLLGLVSGGEGAEEGYGKDGMEEAEEPAISIGGEDEEEMEEEDTDELMKTEESLRRTKSNPALRKLIEEVDAYRARDKREKLVQEAKKACEAASLPKYALTEAFLGILADSNKKNWKPLIEDRRKVIFRGETPVSAVAPNGELTVDSLVKALRS